MSSSTTTALSRQPLREVLKGVEDPRDRRGVRHCLTAILCLSVVGVLAGCRTLEAMREHVADLGPDDLGDLDPGDLNARAGLLVMHGQVSWCGVLSVRW